jgi:two-component system, OmpR family, sensor kinase
VLKRLSVGHRLIGGLLLVGAIGTVSLIYAVLSEYGIPFSALLDPTMRDAASTELFDHVLIPLVVLILPMGLATTWVIRTAFEPLSKAARHIETAPTERGMQIDEADIPTEAKPFVRSINKPSNRRILRLTSPTNCGRRWPFCLSSSIDARVRMEIL